MTISNLPPAPSRSNPSTFSVDADAFYTSLLTYGSEANGLQVTVDSKLPNVIASESAAAISTASAAGFQVSATAKASAEALSASAPLWISGTTYIQGFKVFSSVSNLVYRRLIAGAGTTDPSADATNWGVVKLETITDLPLIQPTLVLDFISSQVVDSRITFTRASTATRINQLGLIETVVANKPRITYNPITLECEGLLVEDSRTNLLLNSTIDGANLATQSVTVTAAAHTLSFYGTGTVTLSGVGSGSLVGSGAYPTRSTLTFTPTAGSLTLTVTGTVQFANLELGSFATSYIPTAGATATRAADVASMTGVNFSNWFRQDEGALIVEFVTAPATNGFASVIRGSVSTNDGVAMYVDTSGERVVARVRDVGVGDAASLSSYTATVGTQFRVAISYVDNAGTAAVSFNGQTAATGTRSIPTSDQFQIGQNGSVAGSWLNGTIRSIRYYPKRLSNAELVALSKP